MQLTTLQQQLSTADMSLGEQEVSDTWTSLPIKSALRQNMPNTLPDSNSISAVYVLMIVFSFVNFQ